MYKSLFILSLLFLISMGFSILNSGGKAGYTGSPVSSGTCNSCHSGGSGTTNVMISATPTFVSGTYTPNTNYKIRVLVQNQNYNHFGFACEILDSLNQDAGTMSNPGAGTQIVNAPSGRKNATHTAPKSGTGATSFEFDWLSSANGKVNFYIGANAVNNNGGTSGDSPNTFTLTLQPSITTSKSTESENNHFVIYPNPAKNEFFINTTEKIQEIFLMDYTGKSYPVTFEPNIQKYKVTLQKSLAPGTYLLQIITDNQKIIYKKLNIQP